MRSFSVGEICLRPSLTVKWYGSRLVVWGRYGGDVLSKRDNQYVCQHVLLVGARRLFRPDFLQRPEILASECRFAHSGGIVMGNVLQNR